MTFAPIETSVEDGNVVEFYTFIFGVTTTRFTSYSEDITFDGNFYQSVPISRSKVQNSVEDAINELKIITTIDNPIASQFIANVPGRVGSITVERAHADDPAEERVIIFEGFIAQVRFTGDLQAEITCNPNTNIFKRTGPRFSFQGLCNHVLYDQGCKVNRLSFLYSDTVISISADGTVIDVSGVSANGADWAVGGFVKAPTGGDEDARLVTAQSGDSLTLLSAFSIDVLNTDVDVFAGCGHDLTTCVNKFANAINYGGFPYIPTKNPFNSSLRGGR